MTPNELYALPSRSVEKWQNDYEGVVEEVLKIELPYGCESARDEDDSLLEVHNKLYYSEDGERGVSVDALYFDGQPFALMFTGGRGGRDSRTPVVTDTAGWTKAREHALARINRAVVFDGHVAVPDEELIDGYYGAALVRFGDEVRLVARDNVSPLTGVPVYDEKAFTERFDAVVRPLGKRIGFQGGLADPEMMAAGVEAFRAGVLGRSVGLDIDLDKHSKIVAASEVDGQTFVHVLNTRGTYYTWARGLRTRMAGPASLFECYADLAAGRETRADCAFVTEAAASFGADPDVVHSALSEFLKEGGKSIAERIIEAMPRDGRVPEELTFGYSSFAAGFMVNDNPDLRRYMDNGYPDLEQARELIDKASELSQKIASGEIERPSM